MRLIIFRSCGVTDAKPIRWWVWPQEAWEGLEGREWLEGRAWLDGREWLEGREGTMHCMGGEHFLVCVDQLGLSSNLAELVSRPPLESVTSH